MLCACGMSTAMKDIQSDQSQPASELEVADNYVGTVKYLAFLLIQYKESGESFTSEKSLTDEITRLLALRKLPGGKVGRALLEEALKCEQSLASLTEDVMMVVNDGK